MALHRVSIVWEFDDKPRLLVFWYRNRVTLGCLARRGFPNGKLLLLTSFWFSCLLDVAESCCFAFKMLLFLSVLHFRLVLIRSGVTLIDLICPHLRRNVLVNGIVLSIWSNIFLIVVRNIIGIGGGVYLMSYWFDPFIEVNVFKYLCIIILRLCFI